MPRLPLVSAPGPVQSLQQGVRVNPGINDPAYNAAERLGQSVSDVGHDLQGVALRAQTAKDSAGLLQLQSMTAVAQQEFQTTRLTKPDTSSWDDDRQALVQQVSEKSAPIIASMSPRAREHAGAFVLSWQDRFGAEANHLKTQQDIKNSIGVFNTAYDMSVQALDSGAMEQTVKDGQAHGLYSGQQAEKMLKQGRQRIAMGQVENDIQADPFTAERNFANPDAYKELNPQQRMAAQFRAAKLANITRSQTQRDLATQMDAALDGNGPMPDRADVDAIAAHQGISPKWVDALFKAPKTFDANSYAKAYTELQSLDLINDPDGRNNARAVELVSQFKGYAATKLGQEVQNMQNPDHRRNSPAAVDALKRMEEAYRQGAFLPWGSGKEDVPGTGFLGFGTEKRDTGVPSVAPTEDDLKAWHQGQTPRAVRDAATQHFADVMTQFRAYIDANPEASDSDLQARANQLMKPYVLGAVAAHLAAPKSTPTVAKPITTEAEYKALPSGARFIWKGREGTKP